MVIPGAFAQIYSPRHVFEGLTVRVTSAFNITVWDSIIDLDTLSSITLSSGSSYTASSAVTYQGTGTFRAEKVM